MKMPQTFYSVSARYSDGDTIWCEPLFLNMEDATSHAVDLDVEEVSVWRFYAPNRPGEAGMFDDVTEDALAKYNATVLKNRDPAFATRAEHEEYEHAAATAQADADADHADLKRWASQR